LSWDALCPKFIESFRNSQHFRVERAPERLLVIGKRARPSDGVIRFSSQIIDFSVHLSMSNDPPISLQLILLDPSSARIGMLRLTWFYAGCYEQALEFHASSNGLPGAVRPAAAPDTVAKAPEIERCHVQSAT
jgi:hypothetical protein